MRGVAPRFFFDDFLSIIGKKYLVLKDRILGNTEFQKTGPYVTGMPGYLGPSRREVKNDVSLYAVCEKKLDKQDRALRLSVVVLLPTIVTFHDSEKRVHVVGSLDSVTYMKCVPNISIDVAFIIS